MIGRMEPLAWSLPNRPRNARMMTASSSSHAAQRSRRWPFDHPGIAACEARNRMPADQAKRVKKPPRKRGFVCRPHPGLPVRSSLALILSGLAPVTLILACLALLLVFLVPLALGLALLLPLVLLLAPLVLACRSWSGWSWSWLGWPCWFPWLWSWLCRSWLRWPWLCWKWLR
jgi:hypothetical protein